MGLSNALGQTAVNTVPAPAVKGDFSSANPRFSALAGPGGFVSGSDGVTIGNFAWATYPPDADGAPATVFSHGFGPVAGFVHRQQQGLNTTYLSPYGMTIPPGFQMGLMDGGDFWAENAGSGIAQVGMKAFADVTDGSVQFAASGTIAGGSSAATTAIVKTTVTLVGSVDDDVLTVASISAGKPYPGTILSSNAVGTVVEQLTNATGPITTANPADYDVGTYRLSVSGQSVAAATTIGGYYGLMTLGTVTGADFKVGDVLTSAEITTAYGTTPVYVVFIITTGGTSGTLVTSGTTAAGAGTVVGSSLVETKWSARSVGGAGELVKISDHP